MNDLELTFSRAPIITSAVGKLKSISSNAKHFAESDTMFDAFAEVFSQMAVVSAPPAEQLDNPAATGDQAPPTAEQETESSADRQSEADAATSEAAAMTVAANGPLPLVETDESEQESVDAELAESTLATEPIERSDAADQPLDTAAMETRPTVNSADETVEPLPSDPSSSVESAPIPELAAESARRQRRDRPTSTAKESGEPTLEQAAVRQAGEPTTEQPSSFEPGQPQQDQLPESSEPERPTTRQEFLHERRTQRRGEGNSASPELSGDQGDRAADKANGSLPTIESSRATATQSAPAATQVRTPPVSPVVDARGASPAAAAVKANAVKSNAGSAATPAESHNSSAVLQTAPGRRIENGQPRETRPNSNDATSMSQRIKLVQRVSRAFQHLGPEGGMIRLRLAPAELGSVRVEMQVQQRKIQARVVTETEAAANALRENLHDLRARLESLGMQIEQLEIETETHDSPAGTPFERESGRRPPSEQREQQPSSHRRSESAFDQPQQRDRTTTYRPPSLAVGGVDLRL
jgi:flagellar hook-length control protein FliK